MGAGILPATWHNGQVYFLFGKEGRYEDSAPGFSDFGGGTDGHESFLRTAVREAGEELTGFLGSPQEVRDLMARHGTYNLDHQSPGYATYRMHIVPMEYNPWLPHFYNRNQRFLQKHLPPRVFRTTKLFEKAEIRWIPFRSLARMRPQFRSYFRHIVDDMLAQQDAICQFVRRASSAKTRRRRPRRSKGTKKNLSLQHSSPA